MDTLRGRVRHIKERVGEIAPLLDSTICGDCTQALTLDYHTSAR